MKKKLIITALAICAITVGTLTTVNARQGCGDGYGPPLMSESTQDQNEWRESHRQNRQEMANEILDLSAEQQAQIKEIREEEKTTSESLREKMQEYREQMLTLTDAESFDENVFRAIAEEKAKIQVDIAVSRALAHNKIHAIMTPEQRKLAQRLRSLRHNQGGMHQGGPGGQRGQGGGWQGDFE